MDMMSYLMGKNSGGSGKGAKIEVVTELPETGESNVIYLVPKQDTGDNDVFDEYVWVNNDWELIGTTDIDLSNYLAKDNTTSYTPTTDYHPATKKYVDNAVASAGSSVPTITITASQIVSQNPLQISMTAEQQAIIEDANVGTLIIDGSALGVNPAYCQKNQDGSTDILLAAFSFAWNGTSGFSISNTTIFAGRYDKETHILHILDTPLLGNTPTADNHLANKKYVDDKSVQYETMPTASADYLGKIVQYTGTTNVNYTNGYFYECVGTTENNVTTYSWSNVEVQSGGNSAIPIYYLQLNGTGSSLELVETLEAIDKVNIAAIITDAYSKGFSNIEIYIRTSNNDSDHCIFTLTDTYSGNPANIQLKPGKMNFTTGIFKSNYFERYMLYLTLSWDGNIATVSAGTMSHSTLWYLTSNNTRVYTPTSDYNPATKKYVDDSIAAAITTTLGGSY